MFALVVKTAVLVLESPFLLPEQNSHTSRQGKGH